MNTATNLVMRATSYSESPSMNAALYRADQRTAHKPERRESSFLDTIVGRRGSLRPILNQVEAVAVTDSTDLINGETRPGQGDIARGLHEPRPRRNPNPGKAECGAIAPPLLHNHPL